MSPTSPTPSDHEAAATAVRRMAWRMVRHLPALIDREQVLLAAQVGLWLAGQSWQPERGPFPAHAVQVAKREAIEELRRQGGREGTERYAGCRWTISLDELDENGERLADLLPDPSDPYAVVIARLALRRAVAVLSQRERVVVALTLAGHTLPAIGERLGVSAARAFQVRAIAYGKMRNQMGASK